jgi:glycosyltransferase involved in cell wall biosynthesis
MFFFVIPVHYGRPNMRIGIDARWIFKELSGIGTYTLELILHLAQLDRQNEYVLFFQDKERAESVRQTAQLDQAPNFKIHPLPYGVFSAPNQLLLPLELRRLNIDVFHSTNFMIPFAAFPKSLKGRTRCVTTIHDLIPLLFPEFAPRSRKTRFFPLYRRLMKEVAARSSLILTDSENSRQDIVKSLGFSRADSRRVQSIPIGVSPQFKPAATRRSGPPTLLYVGRMDPYKNVEGLMRVLKRARELSGQDVRLTIIGPPDDRYPSPIELARRYDVEPHVHWAGYLPFDQLLDTYQQAHVLVLLSRYEGFGLPVLEAMSCGTPVVCSNTSSLPQVAGQAALMVSPDDTEAAAGAITRILTEPTVAQELREKGLRQAEAFNWTHTTRQTLRAYEQVCYS